MSSAEQAVKSAEPGAASPLIPLLSVNFIGTLGYSIVLPYLIFLVTEFGGNAFVYGLLGATYSAFQLVGAPLLGRYSDIYGRKPILLLSQAGTLLAWLMFLAALLLPNIPLLQVDSGWAGQFTLSLPLLILFLGRALDGATGGNISVANAYLVDISSDSDRKSNFGKMAASSNLGFIVGPMLAGLLGATALGEIAPTLAATLISALAMIVILRMLPDRDPRRLQGSPCRGQAERRVLGKEIRDCYEPNPPVDTLRALLAMPGMPLMLLLYFVIFLAFNIFYTAFPVHASRGLDWEMSQLGIYFSILSGTMILVQGPVMSWLSPRVDEKPLLAVGSLVMFASFLLMVREDLPSLYGAAVLFAIGNGVLWPSYLSLLGRMGQAGDQGYIQGMASSSGSLASIVGLIAGGVIYNAFGAISFVVAGTVFLAVFALSFGLPRLAAQS